MVPEEANLVYTLYETDTPSDVSSYGTGTFRSSAATSGTGFYDFKTNRPGDFLERIVDVAAAGTYPVSFRYSGRRPSTWNQNDRCQLWVNGTLVKDVYEFPHTGSDGYWVYSELIDVDLGAGNNAIKLVAASGVRIQIDHLRIGKPPAVLIKSELAYVFQTCVFVSFPRMITDACFLCILLPTADGWPRTIAKNGVNLLNEWPFEFTNSTGSPLSFSFALYPGPRMGGSRGSQHQKNGRLMLLTPEGNKRYLDIGNVSGLHCKCCIGSESTFEQLT